MFVQITDPCHSNKDYRSVYVPGCCCHTAGLLLLNRSVYRGVSIMTDPHEVPEAQFPYTAAAEPDVLINLRPLHQPLAACHAASCSSSDCTQLTPGLDDMYTLLEQAVKRLPGQKQQQQRPSIDVAAIMAQATRESEQTPPLLPALLGY